MRATPQKLTNFSAIAQKTCLLAYLLCPTFMEFVATLGALCGAAIDELQAKEIFGGNNQ